MAQWNQHTIHPHMYVYSSDGIDLGDVVAVYEDSFAIHKGLFAKKHYMPYAAISHIDDERLTLTMSYAEASEKKWEKRPDYEDHLFDPTQLFYDRGHDVQDPFDTP